MALANSRGQVIDFTNQVAYSGDLIINKTKIPQDITQKLFDASYFIKTTLSSGGSSPVGIGANGAAVCVIGGQCASAYEYWVKVGISAGYNPSQYYDNIY